MARRRTRADDPTPGLEEQENLHIPLDRTRITQTALHLLNEIGLKELSMRKIADELNVKTASLYYHVKDKDQLLGWLADKISEEMDSPDPSAPWRAAASAVCGEFRKVLLAYRDAVDIFHSTLAAGFGRLTQIERLYQIFVSAGFADHQIPWLASMLKNFVVGFVAEEVRLAAFAGQGEDAMEKLNERYDRYYRGSPVDRFPNMIRLAPYTANANGQEEFEFGLGVLIDGFSMRLHR
ncbi:TetR/AcrR family transcriptional regulator C-terminal domain-containing protein [Paenibacillus sp. P25]|nr:TetR/AcrR family transcriptional regulator C-terminal domain-containing protein [Paenibacillus sp. P25]